MGERSEIYGVDFSGARDAGSRTWVARGMVEGDGLVVEEVFPVRELEGGARERDAAHGALREYIQGRSESAFGMDFPFGVPRPLVMRGSWEEFVRCFPEDFAGPEEFREFCYQVAGGKERRRVTDREAGAPISPYNRRTYRMTFYGIRDVLNPLVTAGEAVVLPMQERREGAAWVMETCPACTLKERGLYPSYKEMSGEREEARARILDGMEPDIMLSESAAERVIADVGGDGLDAVLAAFAVFRALERELYWCLGDLVEGCIVH